MKNIKTRYWPLCCILYHLRPVKKRFRYVWTCTNSHKGREATSANSERDIWETGVWSRRRHAFLFCDLLLWLQALLFSFKNFPLKHVALTFVRLLIDYARVLLSTHALKEALVKLLSLLEEKVTVAWGAFLSRIPLGSEHVPCFRDAFNKVYCLVNFQHLFCPTPVVTPETQPRPSEWEPLRVVPG